MQIHSPTWKRNGKSLPVSSTLISALTLVFVSSRAPQVGKYSKISVPGVYISYILNSGQGCKDVRSHDFPSIWILQFKAHLHNAVVRCIHFVCAHIVTQVQSMEHTNTYVHYHCLVVLSIKYSTLLYLLKCVYQVIFSIAQPVGKP